MLLLVGLGNPNPNNTNNRHNVGFLVIDAINAKFKLSISMSSWNTKTSFASILK